MNNLPQSRYINSHQQYFPPQQQQQPLLALPAPVPSPPPLPPPPPPPPAANSTPYNNSDQAFLQSVSNFNSSPNHLETTVSLQDFDGYNTTAETSSPQRRQQSPSQKSIQNSESENSDDEEEMNSDDGSSSSSSSSSNSSSSGSGKKRRKRRQKKRSKGKKTKKKGVKRIDKNSSSNRGRGGRGRGRGGTRKPRGFKVPDMMLTNPNTKQPMKNAILSCRLNPKDDNTRQQIISLAKESTFQKALSEFFTNELLKRIAV